MRHLHDGGHHGRLGDDSFDPDRRRYQKIDIAGLDRTSAVRFLMGMTRRLSSYLKGWFEVIEFRGRDVWVTATWHAAFVLAPLTIMHGSLTTGIVEWIVHWLIPMLLFLPLLRFVAEAAKHVYAEGDTIAEVTVSNIGWIHRYVFHPFGDGFHLLHHHFPRVPGYRMARYHKWLMQNEPDYARKLKYRTRLLEQPRNGFGPA